MEFFVDGMSCNNCVKHVTEALHELDENASVNVDLESGKVVFSSEKAIDFEKIKEIIAEYGYSARL